MNKGEFGTVFLEKASNEGFVSVLGWQSKLPVLVWKETAKLKGEMCFCMPIREQIFEQRMCESELSARYREGHMSERYVKSTEWLCP